MRKLVRFATLVVTTCLFLGIASPVHAQFAVYDDFASGSIDPEKWSAGSVEGNPGAPTTEVIRSVTKGSLRLALVSWGGIATGSATVTSLQTLGIVQLGAAGGSGFITGMKSAVTVLEASVTECGSNSAAPVSSARLEGQFFNDGSGAGGDVRALLQLEHVSTGVNRIVAYVVRGSTLVSLTGNPSLFTTGWRPNRPITVELLWDQANSLFNFTVIDPRTLQAESKNISYSGVLSDADPPVADFKGLRVQNQVENCLASRNSGVIDARFDNVEVLRAP